VRPTLLYSIHADVISEVPKCSKIEIFADPSGGAYNAPIEPLADGEGLAAPSKNPIPTLGPSGLVYTGLRV